MAKADDFAEPLPDTIADIVHKHPESLQKLSHLEKLLLRWRVVSATTTTPAYWGITWGLTWVTAALEGVSLPNTASGWLLHAGLRSGTAATVLLPTWGLSRKRVAKYRRAHDMEVNRALESTATEIGDEIDAIEDEMDGPSFQQRDLVVRSQVDDVPGALRRLEQDLPDAIRASAQMRLTAIDNAPVIELCGFCFRS